MISAIVPIYNTPANLLKKNIDSLIKNKLITEIILIDDGSTNLNILSFLETINCEKTTIIHRKNSGVSSSRNYGIKIAKNDWITFVDADDFVSDNFELNEILISSNDIIFSSFSLLIEDAKKKKIEYENGYILNNMEMIKILLEFGNRREDELHFFNGTPWGKIFKKNFLIYNNIFFDENLSNREDALFMINCYLSQPKITFTNEDFYNYRVDSPNSLSKGYKEDIDIIYTYLLTKIRQILTKKKIFLSLQQEFNHYSCELLTECLYNYLCAFENQDGYKKRKTKFEMFTKENGISTLEKIPFTNSKKKKILYFLEKKNHFFIINLIIKMKLFLNNIRKE